MNKSALSFYGYVSCGLAFIVGAFSHTTWLAVVGVFFALLQFAYHKIYDK
jgi:hypothetical protein